LNKLEGAGYVEIEKKFKGKVPLTVCRLTAAGERALLDYSRRMLGILNPDGASANPPRKQRP
jgi:DNA-binding PadR family transcriptional regulator